MSADPESDGVLWDVLDTVFDALAELSPAAWLGWVMFLLGTGFIALYLLD